MRRRFALSAYMYKKNTHKSRTRLSRQLTAPSKHNYNSRPTKREGPEEGGFGAAVETIITSKVIALPRHWFTCLITLSVRKLWLTGVFAKWNGQNTIINHAQQTHPNKTLFIVTDTYSGKKSVEAWAGGGVKRRGSNLCLKPLSIFNWPLIHVRDACHY